MYSSVIGLLTALRAQAPLIVNLSNYVTMDFIANGLLAIGASPVMSLASEERLDFTAIAQAVVINIGTLDASFVRLAMDYCSAANHAKVPLTLDPVGAGASHYRTKTCLDLLERFQFSLIRGNASEIMALAGRGQQTKGVDSLVQSSHAIEAGQLLAARYPGTLIVISGQTDIILEGRTQRSCDRGHAFMSKITGSGCLLSAVLAAFVAVGPDKVTAASAALHFYGHCGELAAAKPTGMGGFKSSFLDALSALPQEEAYDIE